MQPDDRGIGRVRFDRAWDAAELAETLAALAEAGARVLLIEAAGGSLRGWDGARTLWLWRDQPVPSVVAWGGRVAGDVAALALAGDVRVCDAAATLELPAAFDAPAAERLRHLLQLDAGAELPAGTAFAAEAALGLGLVSRVAGAGGYAELGEAVAAAIAARGPIATRLAKEAIWRGLEQPLEQALRFETDLTLLLQTTKDRAEGVRAFLEKRTPQFIGE